MVVVKLPNHVPGHKLQLLMHGRVLQEILGMHKAQVESGECVVPQYPPKMPTGHPKHGRKCTSAHQVTVQGVGGRSNRGPDRPRELNIVSYIGSLSGNFKDGCIRRGGPHCGGEIVLQKILHPPCGVRTVVKGGLQTEEHKRNSDKFRATNGTPQ